ncbi:protein of unknown function [Shinella sp. WSC3-e]|nr:protein of unknown function [Shinella sp. WSC3-e]
MNVKSMTSPIYLCCLATLSGSEATTWLVRKLLSHIAN